MRKKYLRDKLSLIKSCSGLFTGICYRFVADPVVCLPKSLSIAIAILFN